MDLRSPGGGCVHSVERYAVGGCELIVHTCYCTDRQTVAALARSLAVYNNSSAESYVTVRRLRTVNARVLNIDEGRRDEVGAA